MRELEKAHGGEVVVIGVHSAKFMAEKATENLREAVVRYQVDHPVINDRDFAVWNDYAVRAWPTLLFIDPAGRLIAKHEGEASFEALERFVEQALEEYRAEGLIDTSRPLPMRVEAISESGLAFPGKIAVDPSGPRLAIADTNHDRVLVADVNGRVERIFAGLSRPQGVSFGGGALWIAETGASSVQRAEVGGGAIERVAGIGRLAMTREDLAAGALRDPWDVCWLDPFLYIAMAGSHQLWRYDPENRVAAPWAGTGREGIEDGGIEAAWLAQPSGLATDGQLLFVADSEVSAVRRVDVAAGSVRTVVGTGLFDFGDRDGPLAEALLQHAIGVAAAPGVVYVADTYNGKVKRIDLVGERIETLAEDFGEPGGLALLGNSLYVADTNQHRIRVIDLDTQEVATLELTGI
ncbi:MAG TPA: alkyl hydroperoxide reductase [Candidatus Dormibacteraeota bacterium]